MLELNSERQLSGPVARILRRLCSGEDTKRRGVADVSWRGSEVCTVQHVGKR